MYFKKLRPRAVSPLGSAFADGVFHLYPYEQHFIPAFKQVECHTGISITCPPDTCPKILPVSLLDKDLMVQPSIVETKLSGEVIVSIFNCGSQPKVLNRGSIIAYLVFEKIEPHIKLCNVKQLRWNRHCADYVYAKRARLAAARAKLRHDPAKKPFLRLLTV